MNDLEGYEKGHNEGWYRGYEHGKSAGVRDRLESEKSHERKDARIAALEARCRELEAEVSAGRKIYDQYRQGTRNAYECNVKLAEALREIAEHGDAYAKHEAQKALGLTVETPRADEDERCTRCGCAFEDPHELTHECPPGFTAETSCEHTWVPSSMEGQETCVKCHRYRPKETTGKP